MKLLKIKSMTPTTVAPVYDMEIPGNHNFILDNGVIAHNCAYAELGYITLWLKNKYRLEWWSSVLNNEDKEAKTRHYISYLGETIAPPSLKNPSGEFTIRGTNIVAPVSVVKGVGPQSVNELMAKAPFINLKDYVSRVDHSKCNIGVISALIKARAADDLMDDTLPYLEAREKFMKDYSRIRKSKSFKDEMFDTDPIKLFLEERDTNKCFNKPLLSDERIIDLLKSKWPGLHSTNRKAFPLVMGKGEPTHILGGVKIAEAMFHANMAGNKQKPMVFGMMLLFDGSMVRSGTSKKTGKDWECVSVELSDGFNTIEATDWKRNKAYRFPKNTIVYVRAELRKGWKTPVALNIVHMEEVK